MISDVLLSQCLCWTLSLCLLVSGSEVNITAEPGQSVPLPCRVPSNTEIVVAEWTRPELEPKYVLLFKDGWSDPHHQLPSYQNRVELKDREMKDGDVSMILKNVTSNDTGTYECRVFQRKTNNRKKRASLKNEPISIVHLEVHQSGGTEETGDKDGGDKETGDKDGGDKERGEKNHHVGLAVGLPAVLLLVAGLVGVFFYIKHKGPTPVPPDEE